MTRESLSSRAAPSTGSSVLSCLVVLIFVLLITTSIYVGQLKFYPAIFLWQFIRTYPFIINLLYDESLHDACFLIKRSD
jgi:hypothetical protein